MHNYRTLLAAIILIMAASVLHVFAITIPPHASGYVNDYAHMLSYAQARQISTTLQKLEQKTSNQVVVATFNSLNGADLDDFSIKLADKWKIGHKNKDNGAILLIIKNDHRIRMEIGYGLEYVLTDAVTGMIIRHQIVPYFVHHEYFQGINNAVTAISDVLINPNNVTDASHDSGANAQSQANFNQKQMIALFITAIPLLLYAFISVIGNTIFSCIHIFSKSNISYSNRWFGPHAFFRLTLLNVINLIILLAFNRRSGGGGFGGDGGFSAGGGGFGGGGADGGW